jgi:hypothetical protein
LSCRWEGRARRELLDRRSRSGAWSYRAGGVPGVEPTALAILGLIATENISSPVDDRAASREAAASLTAIQREDGSLPASTDPSMPGWATPYAVLSWGGLGGFEVERRRACNWLLGIEGRPLPSSGEGGSVVGHDPTLIGWPWVAETHSWLEPTALAILALCREGLGDHPRVRQGVNLILNRAIPSGGWNYGNRAVFGRTLRPQPGPTGIALLALAARGTCAPAVSAAINYLHKTLPNLRAAASLGWGLLALRAYHACPTEADSWLAEAFDRCASRPDATLGLAVLLLAAGDGALRLLQPRQG